MTETSQMTEGGHTPQPHDNRTRPWSSIINQPTSIAHITAHATHSTTKKMILNVYTDHRAFKETTVTTIWFDLFICISMDDFTSEQYLPSGNLT